MTTIPLGAIHKKTGGYVYPKIANKTDEYICLECHKELILCQGNIRVHHFRHKFDYTNDCHRYNNPTESQIHKDAKLLLKTLIEKNSISFIRKCSDCIKEEEFELPEITETSYIELEYRFEYNGQKIADVAYIDNQEIVCIFEIYYSHKTNRENRPEPWFEIDALSLIEQMNDNINSIKINCIRHEKCEECVIYQQKEENEKKRKKTMALDIIDDWFFHGIEIMPFSSNWLDKDIYITKNTKSKNIQTKNSVDLIIEYRDEGDTYELYHIFLIDTSENYDIINEFEYVFENIAVYYINIDWILSQTERPTQIRSVASFDCSSHFNKTKTQCGHLSSYWIKKINVPNYKLIYIISCERCGYNSKKEYDNCQKCYVLSPLWVMATNNNNTLCKQCDIFGCNREYLCVPYHEKEEAKLYDALWDKDVKKWYVYKDNENIDTILQKWKK